MAKYALTILLLLSAACDSGSGAARSNPGAGGASASTGGQGNGGTAGTGGSPGEGGSAGSVMTTPQTPIDASADGRGSGGAAAGGMAVAGASGGGSQGTAGSGSGGEAGRPDGGASVREVGAGDAKADAARTDAASTPLDVAASDAGALGTVTVYLAGDSTVSTYTNSSIHQAGWGQFLQDSFASNATIVNKAVGGMTARHFIEAGYLDAIVAVLEPGDYLLVQFGTNDGNQTATYTLSGSSTEIPYYLDPETDFKTYLGKYVDATRAKNATTIFVTPPPRHSCNAGETGVRNGLAAYATAMKELGPTLSTPVVDLNAMVIAYLANVSCETSGSTFYLVKADGTIDSTHFQEDGAKIMAGLVARGSSGIGSLDLPLAAYLK